MCYSVSNDIVFLKLMIVIQIVHYLFIAYTIMIFVRLFASWVPQIARFPWMRFVVAYTDPYLNIFRRIIPPIGMFDFSPIIALIALRLLERFVVMPLLIKLVIW